MDNAKCCEPIAERKLTAFEQVINRLSQIEDRQGNLARRCHEKSMRIDNTGEPIKSLEEKDMPESVINILHRIMNRMEENNQIMSYVLSDLENAIM